MRYVDLFFCLRIRLTISSLSDGGQKNEFSTGARRKYNGEIIEWEISLSRLEVMFEKQLLNISAMGREAIAVQGYIFTCFLTPNQTV